jgi:hypothetical protein
MDLSASTPGTVLLPAVPRFFSSSPFLVITTSEPATTTIAPQISPRGIFGAVLAFALTHGHPVAVHECPDLQEFQAVHSSPLIHLLAKIPPVLQECDRFLLASAMTPATPVMLSPLAPLPFRPPTPAQGPEGSNGHSTHALSSLLMHASLADFCGGDPPSVPLGSGTPDTALLVFLAAPPILGLASLSC